MKIKCLLRVIKLLLRVIRLLEVKLHITDYDVQRFPFSLADDHRN